MKRTLLIVGAALFFTAAVNAQTDSLPTPQQQPVRTDKYNNIPPDKYKLAPMPEALTVDKIFPVLGKYTLTDKDGATSEVTVMQDETNKGTVWIEGLPTGRIKANLRKSPAVYRIPAQKTGDEMDEKNQKDVAEGVLIYDKDNNTLNVCIGCKYNAEDPATAFNAPAEPVAEEPAKTTKSKKAIAKTKKEPKVKTVYFTGTKQIEASASAMPETPVQQ